MACPQDIKYCNQICPFGRCSSQCEAENCKLGCTGPECSMTCPLGVRDCDLNCTIGGCFLECNADNCKQDCHVPSTDCRSTIPATGVTSTIGALPTVILEIAHLAATGADAT